MRLFFVNAPSARIHCMLTLLKMVGILIVPPVFSIRILFVPHNPQTYNHEIHQFYNKPGLGQKFIVNYSRISFSDSGFLMTLNRIILVIITHRQNPSVRVWHIETRRISVVHLMDLIFCFAEIIIVNDSFKRGLRITLQDFMADQDNFHFESLPIIKVEFPSTSIWPERCLRHHVLATNRNSFKMRVSWSVLEVVVRKS